MKKLVILLVTVGLFSACDSDSKGKDKYDREKTSADGIEKDDYRNSDTKANAENSKSSANDNNNSLNAKTNNSAEPDNSSTATSWPQNEKRGFINSCEKRVISEGGSKLTAQSYCQCMLDKMEARYPDIKVAAKLTVQQVQQFGEQNRADCLEEH